MEVRKRTECDGRTERRPRPDNLPTLDKFVVQFREAALRKTRRRAFGEALEACVRELRGDEPLAFYSYRDIAASFGVSISWVSEVFDGLRQDGLVRVVRGAGTVLTGGQANRGLRVRGMMAMPVSINAFLTYEPYRSLLVALNCQLRRAGWGGIVDFRIDTQALGSGLAERMAAYEVDTLLWNAAVPLERETLATLSDRGIRVLYIGTERLSAAASHFHLVRSKAAEEAIAAYRSAGLRLVLATCPDLPTSPWKSERTETLLQDAGERQNDRLNGHSDLCLYLDGLVRLKDTVVVFPEPVFPQFLAKRVPDELFQLLQEVRVLFSHGPPTFHFTTVPPVPVDLIRFDWNTIVRQVMQEVMRGLSDEGSKVELRAGFRPETRLDQHAKSF